MIDLEAAASIDIPLTPVPESQIELGSPSTGFVALGEFGGNEYGVWEMTVGSMADVEADELFVVLSGTATVELRTAHTDEHAIVEGQDGSVASLVAGSVGRLAAGMETIWTVSETLRKVYITPLAP